VNPENLMECKNTGDSGNFGVFGTEPTVQLDTMADSGVSSEYCDSEEDGEPLSEEDREIKEEDGRRKKKEGEKSAGEI
jgi:hypothetical protein